MVEMNRLRLIRVAYLHCLMLFFLALLRAEAFNGRHRSSVTIAMRHSRMIIPSPQYKFTRSSLFQSQGVEEDFRLAEAIVEEELGPPTRWSQLSRRWKSLVRFDRKQAAELGVAFMLTYNLVSNINGSIFLSLAWYLTSARTGLSPLAAGHWKGLLATYAGLYVFITIFRPIRIALAVALTKRIAVVLDRTQERFKCSKPVSAGLVLVAMLSFWVCFASCGIALASTLAGVPIWKGF